MNIWSKFLSNCKFFMATISVPHFVLRFARCASFPGPRICIEFAFLSYEGNRNINEAHFVSPQNVMAFGPISWPMCVPFPSAHSNFNVPLHARCAPISRVALPPAKWRAGWLPFNLCAAATNCVNMCAYGQCAITAMQLGQQKARDQWANWRGRSLGQKWWKSEKRHS